MEFPIAKPPFQEASVPHLRGKPRSADLGPSILRDGPIDRGNSPIHPPSLYPLQYHMYNMRYITMKRIMKPTPIARKEILKVFRGLKNKNTVFVDIFTGTVKSYAQYRNDRGEYLTSQPKDAYEFHRNIPDRFMSYNIVDEQIEDQFSLAKEALADEIKFLKNEIGRPIQEWESRMEFSKSQKDMRDRLEFLTG